MIDQIKIINNRLSYLYDICVVTNSAIESLSTIVSVLKEVIIKSKLMKPKELEKLIKIKEEEIESLKVQMQKEYLEKIELEKNKFIN